MGLERQGVVVGLAVAGLIPFAGTAALASLGFESALTGFLFYSLAISAFLCGSWWGIALAKTASNEPVWSVLVLSNGLVIVSVSAIVLSAPTVALVCQALVFVALCGGEWAIKVLARAPRYYQQMRLGVTAVVVTLHLGLALAI